MIRMKCPTCAKLIGIDEAYVGKPALCPGCHGTFLVPAPAILLDEPAPPPPPAPGTSTGPMLPDGHIPLAPESALPPGMARGDEDLWGLAEPHMRGVPKPALAPDRSLAACLDKGPPPAAPPTELPSLAGLGLRPLDGGPGLELPPPGGAPRDWDFLSLDTPAAPAPPPRAESPPRGNPPLPPRPAPAPPLPASAAEPELLLQPLDSEPEEPFVPQLVEPTSPLKAEPVPDAVESAIVEVAGAPGAPLPLKAEIVPDIAGDFILEEVKGESAPGAAAVVVPQPVEPILVVPADAIIVADGPALAAVAEPDYELRPPSLPPPMPAEPVDPTMLPDTTPKWGRDEDRLDRKQRDRDPYRPRKPKKTYGVVSLIPGLDDYYLFMIALGAIWALLAVLVIVNPRLCWFAIIFGGLLHVGATFWLRLTIEEADPIWKWLVFFPPFAAFFAIHYRDRALRAFLASLVGMTIAGMGWAAMPKSNPYDDPDGARPPIEMRDGP
jgi:hypothetical protein